MHLPSAAHLVADCFINRLYVSGRLKRSSRRALQSFVYVCVCEIFSHHDQKIQETRLDVYASLCKCQGEVRRCGLRWGAIRYSVRRSGWVPNHCSSSSISGNNIYLCACTSREDDQPPHSASPTSRTDLFPTNAMHTQMRILVAHVHGERTIDSRTIRRTQHIQTCRSDASDDNRLLIQKMRFEYTIRTLLCLIFVPLVAYKYFCEWKMATQSYSARYAHPLQRSILDFTLYHIRIQYLNAISAWKCSIICFWIMPIRSFKPKFNLDMWNILK